MKIPQNSNKGRTSGQAGFTLVELMVVVAITAILTGGAISSGWGNVNNSMGSMRAGEVIKDIVSSFEQDISLKRKYSEVTLHFFKDHSYLIAVAKPKGHSLELEWDKSLCNGKGGLSTTNKGILHFSSGKITKAVSSSEENVCNDFLDSDENKWHYQLVSDTDVSPEIHLLHFNLDREKSPAQITSDDSRLVMSAPYAKKRFYDGSLPEPNADGKLAISLENDSGTANANIY